MICSSARAQQCIVPYEMLTKLHHPEPGAFTVWDAVFGEPRKEEEFVSVARMGEGVLVAGEMRTMAGVAPSLMLVHFDRRGRKVWDLYYAIGGLRNVVKILPHKDGYAVFANRKKSGQAGEFWIGFFDREGKLKKHKVLNDKKFHLYATDVVRSIDGGWIVSISAQRLGADENAFMHKYAAVYLLNDDGSEIASRSYVLGTNNEISSLSVSKFDGEKVGYIATGYFENGSKQKMGWALRLDHKLSLVWQKEFRRGKMAKVQKGVGYKNHDVVILGEVEPLAKGPTGSWLAMLDGNNGEIKWQRYFYGETGHHNYEAEGVYVNKDGLITSMMMARSSKSKPPMASKGESEEDDPALHDDVVPEYMTYAHILTFSPRGIVLDGDAYYYGEGVSMVSLVEGAHGYRMMVGYTLMPAVDIFTKMKKKVHDKPLKEYGEVQLPDAVLSGKAKKGLAMLKKKIKHQAEEKHSDVKNAKDDESAKPNGGEEKLTRNAWIVIGDAPDAYSGPCKNK